MILKDQVISLDQAKRLKELGVVQNGVASWWQNTAHNTYSDPFVGFGSPPEHCMHLVEVAIAFTVAELGVMLPKDHQWTWPVNDKMDAWTCAICEVDYEGATARDEQFADTEAEARAAMLIHLLESSLVTAEEVNNRLNS